MFLRVFQNPLGIASISSQHLTQDARAAHLLDESLQVNSPAATFDITATITLLSNMRCKDYNGTRIEFVVEFFDVICRLNEKATNLNITLIGYEIAKGLLIGSFKG